MTVSTLTCPDWTLEEIAEKCRSYGIEAIDFRGLNRKMKLWETPEFSEKRIPGTLEFLRSHGLHICGISTSARLSRSEGKPPVDEMMDEARRSIDLAHTCGAHYIRIFGGALQGVKDKQAARQEIVQNYRDLCRYSEDREIRVLVETHDETSRSEDVKALVDEVGHPNAGVIWDVRHPLHIQGESFSQTVGILGSRIKVVHIKDFRKDPDYTLVTYGTGDFDPAELFEALKTIGFESYLVLEIPKAHRSDLAEPEVNIPRFAGDMKAHRLI